MKNLGISAFNYDFAGQIENGTLLQSVLTLQSCLGKGNNISILEELRFPRSP